MSQDQGIILSRIDINKLDGDVLFLGLRENERPLGGLTGLVDWRMGGFFSEIVSKKRFTGELSDKLLVHTRGKIPIPRIVVVGMGNNLQLKGFREVGKVFRSIFNDLGGKNVSIGMDTVVSDWGLDPVSVTTEFLGGFQSYPLNPDSKIRLYVPDSLQLRLKSDLKLRTTLEN